MTKESTEAVDSQDTSTGTDEQLNQKVKNEETKGEISSKY